MTTEANEEILRLRDVEERTKLKHSAIYALIAEGDFPAAIALGPRARGWLASEVTAWMRNRPRAEKWRPGKGRAA